MSKPMDILDALEILMKGGYISETCPPLGKRKYRVHEPPVGNKPCCSAGRITEGAFEKIARRGLIVCTRQLQSKCSPIIYNFWDAAHPAKYQNDPQSATHGNRIRAMTDAELADFLHDATLVADTPWNIEFSKVFCDSCEPDFCQVDMECPHGRPVDWWLGQKTEVEK